MGVDSFYTLYSNINKIDAILFVIGFDIKSHQKNLLDETIENLKKVAEIYNKKLILCETDLKNKVPGWVKGFNWGEYFHGPALFNIAYILKDYNELLIPSSHAPNNNYIWGSLFKLDKNYSSSILNILHNNNDVLRVAKIKFILDYDPKCLNFLRVCWINKDGKYNCTACEKCLRTLYPIELCGYKKQAITFDINANGSDYWRFESKDEAEEAFKIDIMNLEEEMKKKNFNSY